MLMPGVQLHGVQVRAAISAHCCSGVNGDGPAHGTSGLPHPGPGGGQHSRELPQLRINGVKIAHAAWRVVAAHAAVIARRAPMRVADQPGQRGELVGGDAVFEIPRA
jgi:hypothetical protein